MLRSVMDPRSSRWITAALIGALVGGVSAAACTGLWDIDDLSYDRYTAAGCKDKCAEFVHFASEWVASRLAGEGF